MNLKELSLSHVAKKEITDLDSVDLNLEVKESEFQTKEGTKAKFNYIEIDNYKYTIKSKVLSALKNIMTLRPQTTKVKFNKNEDGSITVIPLD